MKIIDFEKMTKDGIFGFNCHGPHYSNGILYNNRCEIL